jgi:hypothetical protein
MRAGRRPLWLPAASVQLLISAPLRRTTSRTLEPEGPAAQSRIQHTAARCEALSVQPHYMQACIKSASPLMTVSRTTLRTLKPDGPAGQIAEQNEVRRQLK